MISFKSVKCSMGIALSIGLSSCTMWDMQRPEHRDSRYEPMTQQHAAVVAAPAKSKPVQKTYATKDPTQKATPGPTRKAAPQLPVIQ